MERLDGSKAARGFFLSFLLIASQSLHMAVASAWAAENGRPGFGRMANGIRRLSLVRIMYARIQKLKVTSVYPNMSLACIGCLFIGQA